MSSNADWLNWPETKSLIACFPEGTFRFVGGCVRDRLLKRTVTDVDAATTLLPEATMEALKRGGHKAIPTGIAHGTITAVIAARSFEITTLRADTACDGRHAQVAFTDSWQQDASRRDFTMNALYLSPEGKYFDYHHGADDAKAGHVRFIGEAQERIREDYLRILRFFRFYAFYGRGDADKAALFACSKERQGIAGLSGERIRHEMFKLLDAAASRQTLELMQQCGVLEMVFPSAPSLQALTQLEASGFKADALAKLALLLRSLPEDPVAAISQRWKLSTAESKRLARLVSEALFPNGMNDAQQKKQLRRLGKADFCDLVALSAAYAPGYETAYRAMVSLAEQWAIPEFPVKGADLIKRGIPQGEVLGNMLAEMEDAWEDSGYQLSRETLLGRIKEI